MAVLFTWRSSLSENLRSLTRDSDSNPALLEELYLLPGRLDADRKAVRQDSRINNHLDCDTYSEAENPIFVA